MKNIFKELIEKDQIDSDTKQNDLQSNQHSIQNNSNDPKDSDTSEESDDEEEVHKIITRKPQFRIGENNKRRFF